MEESYWLSILIQTLIEILYGYNKIKSLSRYVIPIAIYGSSRSHYKDLTFLY